MNNYFFDPLFLLTVGKLSLAMVLGLLLGLERVYAHKTAGMRTYALASVATCFFVIISMHIGMYISIPGDSFSPAQIAAAVITGIGFLGAGLIFFKDDHVQNLTQQDFGCVLESECLLVLECSEKLHLQHYSHSLFLEF